MASKASARQRRNPTLQRKIESDRNVDDNDDGAAPAVKQLKLSRLFPELKSVSGASYGGFKYKNLLLCISLCLVAVYLASTNAVTKTSITNDRRSIVLTRATNHSNYGYRPQLILHVGPPKTATTTLQCSFVYNSNLLEDFSPYRYIGKWQTKDCKGPMHNISYPYILPRKRHSLDEISEVVTSLIRDSKSPIYSNELISQSLIVGRGSSQEDDFVELAKSLTKIGNNVRLVATYRRYYEWVPSYYREQMEVLVRGMRSKGPIQTREFMNRKFCFVSFQSYLEHFKDCQDLWELHRMDEHPLQMVQNAAINLINARVEIFNMYNSSVHGMDLDGSDKHNPEKHILYMFAGKALVKSLDFQTELKLGHGYLTPPLHTMEQDRISWEYIPLMVNIYGKGLVSKKITPKKLLTRLESSHERIKRVFYGNQRNHSFSFPKVCLETSLRKRLLELSLKFETELFPDWSTSQTQVHRDEFVKYVEKGNYCQWDSGKILESDSVVRLISGF